MRLIALALIAEQPRHGYEIIKLLEDKTAGWYSPSPGIVYPTLTYLEEVGYVTAQPEGAKRLYTITAEGRAHLEENRDFVDAVLERLGAMGERVTRMRRRAQSEEDERRGPERFADGARGDREPARGRGQAARRRRRCGGQGGRDPGGRRVATASHLNDHGAHQTMSTLDSPAVAALLTQLFAHADRDDPATFERVNVALKQLPHPPDQRQRAELMRDVYMPISPDVGRLLYILARTRSAKLVVEFGTSFGISGIHLAAAVRDAGGGRLIATELDPIKAERAAHNFRAAGLSEVIDLRVGDAFETLKSGLGGGIDLLLLDGWKEAYLPMLRFLEPKLSPNALVVADDLDIAPEALAPYLDYVRKPGNGYVSVEMPLGDRIELSMRS